MVRVADVEAAGEHRRGVHPRDIVGDGDGAERHVAAGVSDVVGPGHGASDGHDGTVGGACDGRAVVVGAVGQFDDLDDWGFAEVVIGVGGGDIGSGRRCAGGGADVAVLTGDGRAAGREHPGLARLQQVIVVRVADVEAAGEHRRGVDARDIIGDGDGAERHVAAGVSDVVGPGRWCYRRARWDRCRGACDGGLSLLVPLVSLTI